MTPDQEIKIRGGKKKKREWGLIVWENERKRKKKKKKRGLSFVFLALEDVEDGLAFLLLATAAGRVLLDGLRGDLDGLLSGRGDRNGHDVATGHPHVLVLKVEAR